MRVDMAKLLMERPRYGHSNGPRTSRMARRGDRLELGRDSGESTVFDNKSSMTRHLGGPKRARKELSENLQPLVRFLRSRLGRSWDEVYGEIMSRLNLTNTVQYHVYQHLCELGLVYIKTYIEGGVVMAATSRGPEAIGRHGGRDFYIDPVSRLLCVTDCQRPTTTEGWQDQLRANRCIEPATPTIQFHRIGGVWYELTLRRANREEVQRRSFGVYRRAFNGHAWTATNHWDQLCHERMVDQIAHDRGLMMMKHRPLAAEPLWKNCQMLFGGPFLPTAKRQVNSRMVARIEALISANIRARSVAA